MAFGFYSTKGQVGNKVLHNWKPLSYLLIAAYISCMYVFAAIFCAKIRSKYNLKRPE